MSIEGQIKDILEPQTRTIATLDRLLGQVPKEEGICEQKEGILPRTITDLALILLHAQTIMARVFQVEDLFVKENAEAPSQDR